MTTQTLLNPCEVEEPVFEGTRCLAPPLSRMWVEHDCFACGLPVCNNCSVNRDFPGFGPQQMCGGCAAMVERVQCDEMRQGAALKEWWMVWGTGGNPPGYLLGAAQGAAREWLPKHMLTAEGALKPGHWAVCVDIQDQGVLQGAVNCYHQVILGAKCLSDESRKLLDPLAITIDSATKEPLKLVTSKDDDVVITHRGPPDSDDDWTKSYDVEYDAATKTTRYRKKAGVVPVRTVVNAYAVPYEGTPKPLRLKRRRA